MDIICASAWALFKPREWCPWAAHLRAEKTACDTNKTHYLFIFIGVQLSLGSEEAKGEAYLFYHYRDPDPHLFLFSLHVPVSGCAIKDVHWLST